MAKLNTNQIRELAREIILQNPGGIRFSELRKRISSSHPETPINTIDGSVWDLHLRFPQQIQKPIRGLFVPAEQVKQTKPNDEAPPTKPSTPEEKNFYPLFAEWLKNDLDEVTDAAPIGGAAMGKKWGTPDVVGVYKPLASNLIKFPLEIVSAEIKTDPTQPVIAFGQAIAYRLFSAKTYIVMPASMSLEDLSRLEALCMLFGVGLVLFENSIKAPNFQIRVRAQRFNPDMFYVNEFAERLKEFDPDKFERLFR
jgi:hypothetical protein